MSGSLVSEFPLLDYLSKAKGACVGKEHGFNQGFDAAWAAAF
jgi:hypothetical protein